MRLKAFEEENKEIKEQNKEIKAQLADIKNAIVPIGNNNNNSTINSTMNANTIVNNYNITINPFGEETMDHIKIEELVELMKHYHIKSFIHLQNLIYDHPSNQNVRMLSSKNKRMEVFTGETWDTQHTNIVVDKMVQKTNELGFKVFTETPELNELDATEDYDHRIRKMLMNIACQKNKDYHTVRHATISRLETKKKRSIAAKNATRAVRE